MKIHTFVFTVSTHLSWVLNTICILCFFGRLCNTAERRSCSIFFYFLLFSRYFFHFHIRFIYNNILFLEFHSAAAGSPQSILHRMGNFISYTQKIYTQKGTCKSCYPFPCALYFHSWQQKDRRTCILLFQISKAASPIKKLQPTDKPACPISPELILWTDIHRFWCQSW